jgi:hypothetical protein
MPMEIEQLIYFLIPIAMIVVGIYFLLIHGRRCTSCGRSVRPFWRECPCASAPSTVFSPAFEEEIEEEQEISPMADIAPFPYEPKPEEKPQFVSPADISPAEIEPEIEADIKPETKTDAKSFSYDDAERMGTQVMLPEISSAWLVIQEQELPERKYEIKGPVTSIGTSDDNDVVLADKAVSRHHAKIRIEGPKYFVYDLASTNGTKVNERKITKKSVKEGDSIEMGHTTMTFVTEGPPSEPLEYKHKPSDLFKM